MLMSTLALAVSIVAVTCTVPTPVPTRTPVDEIVAEVAGVADQVTGRLGTGCPATSNPVAVSCRLDPTHTDDAPLLILTDATGGCVTVTGTVVVAPSLVAVTLVDPG